MIMYKVPTELISPKELEQVQGTEGTYLAPKQDENNNWVVSVEEWESKEMQEFKEKNPDIAAGFEKIETKLKDYSYSENGNI